MKNILKVCLFLIRLLLILTGVLFVVYFWNLDQKLMAWAYTQVNKIFDRKKENLNF